ncbi:polysaccharide lyase family 7 protein [Allokutzneria oryzae]|uniref:Polysaccharide lyase family 7 protein n=1 Tax=Allokutzneria oryzae TaxID=1378989 RepID=A0ABV5ZQF0_9PSEU
MGSRKGLAVAVAAAALSPGIAAMLPMGVAEAGDPVSRALAWERYDVPDVEVLAPGGTSRECSRPAQVLDLRNWKVTLPVDDPDKKGEQPLEITQPRLDGYVNTPWFVPADNCDGVQFRAPVNGVTTANSKNPRSELREMTNNGTTPASWRSDSGTHTMVIDQAITRLPTTKPHVVAGQIHDSSDDVTVFRLEGSKLYVTKGDNTHYRLITDNYVLGTRFQAKFEVRDGKVRAYYNGVLQATIPASFTGAYFKAGTYTQANCGNSSPCDASNYGQVTLYRVTVTHS